MSRILITAALPYANGDLHLGGVRSTYVPADVFARFCRLSGKKTLFCCATDEHGTPIEVNAQKEGLHPEKFVEKYHKRQKKDFDALGVSFDVFYHTHSPENHKLSHQFYRAAQEKGLIFEKEVEQTFCANCTRFLPDRFVKGTCPFCGALDQYGDGCEKCGKVYAPRDLKDPRCAICGKSPTAKKVKHAFFKLSACGEPLDAFLSTAALQKDVVSYVRNWLTDLKDWDITRDGPYFGIEIPERNGQYFYVWFDAPIGYMASVQAWCDANGEKLSDWWNEENQVVHFIGKDIVYHHYLFWPAMLDAAGFAFPSRIPTRGFLNVEGEKMSKSRGTFVLVKDVLGRFSADSLRYYLCTITPNSTADGNFAWKDFQAKVNNELIGAYGNFVYRVLSFIQRQGGVVPVPSKGNPVDEAFEKRIDAFFGPVTRDLEQVGVKEALEKVMAFASEANKYFNDRAPWHLKEEKELNTVLYLSAKAAFALASALYPFIPFSSEQVFKQFGVFPKKWADVSAFKAGLVLSDVKPLFLRMEDRDVDAEIRKLLKKH
ncbi:methionine--tRNA ligase [Candidatus Micrarchaeota archaeon]|nr:methionine--tRNA ligase [Candidatus Micrarchaeota archaeon]